MHEDDMHAKLLLPKVERGYPLFLTPAARYTEYDALRSKEKRWLCKDRSLAVG